MPRPKVKIKDSMSESLKRTAMDAAYTAAKGVERTYGPGVREALHSGKRWVAEVAAGEGSGGIHNAAEDIIRRTNDPETPAKGDTFKGRDSGKRKK